MQRYKIIVGDWSGDGHEKTTDYYVEVSHEKETIVKAYNKTRKASKVSVTSLSMEEEANGYVSVCAEYEQNELSAETLDKLIAVGVNRDDLMLEDGYDDDFDVWEEGIIHLFFAMAKASLPELSYNIIQDETEVLIEGIGYGCFY